MKTSIEETNLEFRLLLQNELSRRIRVNERYSIRAFARHLDLDSSTLSQILAGKRALTLKMMKKISSHLGINFNTPTLEPQNFNLIQEDQFAAISDWYHFAILDLALLKSFKSNPQWISTKLGIQAHEAQTAIERLLRLGMLKQEGGKLKKAETFFTNYSEGMTSAAHKEYQRQVLTLALKAIDEVPAERKDITSITIAANSKKIKLAKEKIKKFRRELCQFLEDDQKDAVLHLAIQLYPVTKYEN